ncbi:MAG: hypothetical protein R3C53_16590 [Pirellulaceae bacterium]
MKLIPSCIFCAYLFFVGSGLAVAQDAPIEPGDSFGEDFGFDTGDMNFGEEDFSFAVDPAQERAAAAVATGFMIVSLVIGLLGLCLMIFVAYFLSDGLAAVPEEFRQLPTWVPWLLLVPFVNIVVLILAFIKVPQSLSSYLASKGNTGLGDCGQALGLWGSILYLLCFPVGLVLLLMSGLKISQAKKAARA